MPSNPSLELSFNDNPFDCRCPSDGDLKHSSVGVAFMKEGNIVYAGLKVLVSNMLGLPASAEFSPEYHPNSPAEPHSLRHDFS